jgi:hypothetical protein
MKLIRNLKLTLGSLVVAGLAACGGGGGTAASNGSLRLALTDAPSCGYDAVNVTIQKIRVNQNATASDTDGGWSEIVLNPALRVDLLGLTNGVLAELGQTPLPVGKYTQLRLVLADNAGATPLANSVVLSSDKSELALKTPSGQQSGLKTNINIDIAANQMADFVLDFDACKSVVLAGSSGQYLLKPVVSVIPRLISGVTGFVNLALANGSTTVSLQTVDGAVIKATTPDIVTGKFLLQPAAPGNYSLVLTAPSRNTTVVTQVPVVAETVTSLNDSATALSPALAASASATASGSAPEDTLVRVLQPLTGGPTIEVASGFVGGITVGPPPMGSYSFPLIVNAPLVAPYVAMPSALTFAADTLVAGKYALSASLNGVTKPPVAIGPLAAGSTVTTNFAFP